MGNHPLPNTGNHPQSAIIASPPNNPDQHHLLRAAPLVSRRWLPMV